MRWSRQSRDRLWRRSTRRDGCLIGLIGLLLPFAAAAQPANDLFAHRARLEGNRIQVAASNVGATVEAREPRQVTDVGGGTVWWEWIPGQSGQVVLSTSGSGIDTVLSVFLGDDLADLVLVASNDDEDLLGGIFTSRVRFLAQGGTRYQIVVAGLRGAGNTFDSGAIGLSIAPAPNQAAPAWEVTDIQGRPLRMRDLMGKVVLLDFWATWCAPCRAEIPFFIELQNRHADEGFTVVGFSVDKTGTPGVLGFMDELGINYPVAFTSPMLERELGGVPSIPTAFVIDRAGNIVERHIGFGDKAFWERILAPLLADPVPGPRLAVRVDGGQVVLRWPLEFAGYAMESAGDPGASSWRQRTEVVHVDDAGFFVALPIMGEREFYRLRRMLPEDEI